MESLEHVALATSLDQDWENEKVNLMTLHASKGLEFNIVYLPGWEGDYFLIKKVSRRKVKVVLKKKRLAYVGITRAKKLQRFLSL